MYVHTPLLAGGAEPSQKLEVERSLARLVRAKPSPETQLLRQAGLDSSNRLELSLSLAQAYTAHLSSCSRARAGFRAWSLELSDHLFAGP